MVEMCIHPFPDQRPEANEILKRARSMCTLLGIDLEIESFSSGNVSAAKATLLELPMLSRYGPS